MVGVGPTVPPICPSSLSGVDAGCKRYTAYPKRGAHVEPKCLFRESCAAGDFGTTRIAAVRAVLQVERADKFKARNEERPGHEVEEGRTRIISSRAQLHLKRNNTVEINRDTTKFRASNIGTAPFLIHIVASSTSSHKHRAFC